MSVFPTPVTINVNRTKGMVNFQLVSTGPSPVGLWYETADPVFLREVRDLLNDALTFHPDEPQGS